MRKLISDSPPIRQQVAEFAAKNGIKPENLEIVEPGRDAQLRIAVEDLTDLERVRDMLELRDVKSGRRLLVSAEDLGKSSKLNVLSSQVHLAGLVSMGVAEAIAGLAMTLKGGLGMLSDKDADPTDKAMLKSGVMHLLFGTANAATLGIGGFAIQLGRSVQFAVQLGLAVKDGTDATDAKRGDTGDKLPKLTLLGVLS